MRDTIKEILDSCPTHGFCTVGAHSLTCPNEEHRKLAACWINKEIEREELRTEIYNLEDEINELKMELRNL